MTGGKAFLIGLLLSAAAYAPAIAQAPAGTWEPYSAGLLSRATGGDVAAQYALGEAYRTGNGIGQDREQAINWFRRAAPRDPRAADALGVLLFTKGERKQAIPLLQAAATRRNDYALYILGTARFNGDYVPKDVARAYADMKLAARSLPQAQRSLGLMEPYVTPADRSRADQLAAQADGPESGAPAAPAYLTATPMPARAPAATAVVPTPRPASPAAMPAPVVAPAAASAPSATSPLPAAAGAPASSIRPVDLPPSQPAVATPAATPAPVAPVAPPPVKSPPIAKPPVRSAPVAAVAKGGAWRVQLGAYGSEDRAAGQWKALAAKVPTLVSLQKVTQPVGALVRLQATGLADRDAANALCTAVTAAGGPCLVLAPATAP